MHAPLNDQNSGLRKTGVATCASVTTLAIVWLLMAAVVEPAFAQNERVIYNFRNLTDAYGPKCNLVLDAAGNMYGTTSGGGVHDLGAVFRVSPTGMETVLYSFAGGADGSNPVAGLFRDPATGNLYGTTVNGGAFGNGTVFKLTPAGAESVLYSFKGGTVDGANPYSSVVRVGTTIYGTTFNGGAFGYGTVFKLSAAGQERKSIARQPPSRCTKCGSLKEYFALNSGCMRRNLRGPSHYPSVHHAPLSSALNPRLPATKLHNLPYIERLGFLYRLALLRLPCRRNAYCWLMTVPW